MFEGVCPFEVDGCKLGPIEVLSDVIMLLKDLSKVIKLFLHTYSIPKLSTIRQNITGCHLLRHIPGFVVVS